MPKRHRSRPAKGKRRKPARSEPTPALAPEPRYSVDALYWVAGPYAVTRRDELCIEEPMAIAREQILAVHRGRLAQEVWLTAMNDPLEAPEPVVALPVSDELAQVVISGLRSSLARARAGRHKLDMLALRIGLGDHPLSETEPPPAQLRENALTREDGSPLTPITPDMLATLREDGLYSTMLAARAVERAQPDLDPRPQYAAGLGQSDAEKLGEPRIAYVMAIAHEPERAAIRALWRIREMFTEDGVNTARNNLAVTGGRVVVLPVTARDARRIRRTAEWHGRTHPDFLDAGLGNHPEAEKIQKVTDITTVMEISMCAEVDGRQGSISQYGRFDTDPTSRCLRVW
ncbi:MAG: hypothetical protein OXG35_17700 [Acidobacteria bacterium]|nr:hypothetical protein [Acidobacteriota bacterium]